MGYPVDRIQLYNQNGVPLPELYPNEVESRVRHEEINGEHTLTIITKRKLSVGWRAVTVDNMGKWREWVVEEADELHDAGINAVGTYRLVWSLQYDLTYTFDDSGDLGHREIGIAASATGRAAVEAAISGSTKWEVSERCDVPAITAGGGVVMIAESAWSRLSKVVTAWGGEIDAEITVDATGVASRKVLFVSHLGKTEPTRRFEWGEDLTSIKRTPDPGPYYCRVVPIGKGTTEYAEGPSGADPIDDEISYEWPLSLLDDPEYDPHEHEWIEDPDVVEVFRVSDGNGGWEYPTKIVKYDKDDVQLLYEEAMDDLHNHTRPNITYEASVVQFARAGLDAKGVALGDEIQIVDRGFNPDAELRIQERVTAIDIDELDDDRTELVIGQKQESLADTIASMNSDFDEAVSRLTYYTTTAYVRDLIGWFNDEINRTGGYTYLVPGRGQITYDVAVSDPNVGIEATKAVEIRGGSIRIGARSGSDGSWVWKSVFTDGAIATDMIIGGKITTGFIGSVASGNYWDLDNGTFRLGSTTKLGDSDSTVDDIIVSVDVMYAESTSDTEPPTTGWRTTCPERRDGYYIWQKTVTATNNGPSESTPTCISGRDGYAFNNANVVIYKRGTTVPAVPSNSLTYSFDGGTLSGTLSGWSMTVPNGDDPCWVTSAAASSTTATDTILPSEWAAPVRMFRSGIDGLSNAVVMLYRRSATSPSMPTGTFTYTFSTGKLTGGSIGSWSQSIPSGTDPCWVIAATASSAAATDTITANEFSSPVKLVENGSDGLNNTTINLYQRKATAPNKPTISYRYDFSTGSLSTTGSGSANGWVTSVPDGTAPIWIIAATASSSDTTDVIPGSEFSDPVKFVENGTNQATVYLYQRKATTPNKPTITLTYTFETGALTGTINNGWQKAVPSGTDPCWVISAVAISTGTYDTITSSEWSDPTTLASNGLNTATARLYIRSATQPSKPSLGALTYTFSTGTLTGTMRTWSPTIPSGNDPCWMMTATAASYGDTDTITSTEWSDPIKLVENGLNQATVFLYKALASAPTGTAAAPTNTLTYTFATHALSSTSSSYFNGWSQTIPSGTTSVWVIAATAVASSETDTIPKTEWSTPVQLTGKDGVGLKLVVEQYTLVKKTQTGGPSSSASWSTECPVPTDTADVWTRSKITWDDESVTYTDPVKATTVNKAYEIVHDLDESLDSKEVFNRLTNNGSLEVMERDPQTGRIIINASYIATGRLASKKGDSYWDFNTGLLNLIGKLKMSMPGYYWANQPYGQVGSTYYYYNSYDGYYYPFVDGGTYQSRTGANPIKNPSHTTQTGTPEEAFHYVELGRRWAHDSEGQSVNLCGLHIYTDGEKKWNGTNRQSSVSGDTAISIAANDNTYTSETVRDTSGSLVTYTRPNSLISSEYGMLITAMGAISTNRPMVGLFNNDAVLASSENSSHIRPGGSGASREGLSQVRVRPNWIELQPSIAYNGNVHIAYVRSSEDKIPSDATSISYWASSYYSSPQAMVDAQVVSSNLLIGTDIYAKERLVTNGDIKGASLKISGTKNRVVSTEDYGDRLLYCYETSTPMFGDLGFASTDEDGVCYVSIDDIFTEASRTDIAYHVFLQKCGEGDLWVEEKNPTYFVVRGTPNLQFDWEVKVRQVGYDQMRLEQDDLFGLNEQMPTESAIKEFESVASTGTADDSINDIESLYTDEMSLIDWS